MEKTELLYPLNLWEITYIRDIKNGCKEIYKCHYVIKSISKD